MRIIDYKAMLFGFLFGDGWLSISKRNLYNGGFSGDSASLEIAKNDLINIYGDIGLAKITTKETVSEKYGISGTTSSFVINKKVIDDFINLGAPIGKKVEQNYLLPEWVTSGDIDIKRYFISGLYAAEGYTPTMQHNGLTPKSIGFNLQKRIEFENSFRHFIDQLSQILNDLNINHSIEFTYVNTHHNNIKCAIIFYNNIDNMLNIFNMLYIRYNISKCTEFDAMKQYLLYKQECITNLQNAYIDVLKEPRIPRQILCDKYKISNSQIDNWRRRKTGVRIPNNFVKYNQFKTNILSI